MAAPEAETASSGGPGDITIDKGGAIYVADFGNDRVQKFSADGEHLLTFGSSSEDGGDLSHPSDVAVDSEGDVYVVDFGNNRVQIYDPEGDIITALYGDAQEWSNWAREVVEANPDVVKAYRRLKDMTPVGRFARPVSIARRLRGSRDHQRDDPQPASGLHQGEGLHGPAVQPVTGPVLKQGQTKGGSVWSRPSSSSSPAISQRRHACATLPQPQRVLREHLLHAPLAPG